MGWGVSLLPPEVVAVLLKHFWGLDVMMGVSGWALFV